MVSVDDSAKSFDAPPVNEPEPPTELTSQVVSQGCQQVVSEVVSKLSDTSATTKAPQPPAQMNHKRLWKKCTDSR